MNSKDSNKSKSQRNNKRQSSRGPRRTTKRNNYKDEIAPDRVHAKSTLASNDPSWYANTPQLLIDSASLPYSYAVGSKIPIPYDTASIFNKDYKMGSIPGIMSIGILPGVGISTDNSSPVNIAARKIYAWVRHANSGSRIYDSPDLMLYLLAMDNIYTMYSHCMRALGFARLYSQKNRYLADALITAMGFDADDLQKNLADYRFRLNTIGAKISSMAVPNTMSYFARHAWMFQNVYKDGDSDKAQLYVFRPAGYYYFDAIAETTGGSLRYAQMDQAEVTTFAQRVGALNSMVSRVIEDEDMNVMSGDIIKAYGTEKLIKIGMIPEDILLAPIYDQEVLSQIQNIQFIGSETASTCNITQSTAGALLFNPKFVMLGNAILGEGSVFFNQMHDNVTPAETMVASRLTNIPSINGSTVSLSSCGSEIATSAKIWYFDNATEWILKPYRTIFSQYIFDVSNIIADPDTTINGLKNCIMMVALLSQFDYHPQFRLGVKDSAAIEYYNTLWDVENYTIVTENELSRMHQTALLSEFDVEGVGRA